MSQIDPTRLSRVLATLTKPRERVDSRATPATGDSATDTRTAAASRDPAVLRARLQQRLRALKAQMGDGFREAAPQVAVQEILCWEFGDEILEHAEFERIARQVVEAMLADAALEGAVQRVIGELGSV